MKLYYAPGACSLAPHIVAREAGIALELERVDLRGNPHRTESGADFTAINPKGYVPALRLDDGQLLTEGPPLSSTWPTSRRHRGWRRRPARSSAIACRSG